MKKLDICTLLFDFMNSNGIRYCHWKSNSHLDKALIGKTDLDILVHPDDKSQFELVCKKFDIKKIQSPPEKQFPGLEDYLGFDFKTGCFVHLHIHYQLVMGQRFIKNHILPLVNVFFENLTVKNGVAIPVPELELIILIIRLHMKLDNVSLLKQLIRDLQGQFYLPFPQDVEDELKLLIGSSSITKLSIIHRECSLPVPFEIFTDFIDKYTRKKLKLNDFIKCRKFILASFKQYQRDAGVFVYVRYTYLLIMNSKALAFIARKNRKTLVGQGKIFSLIGADGSGKSTLIADLDKWLSWKLNVKRYYYGIPKNYIVKSIDCVIRVTTKLQFHFVSTLLENCLWLYVARKRFKIYESTIGDADRSELILTDRFPLREFIKMETPMDGPRLNRLSKNYKFDIFSHKEAIYYNKIIKPDCLLVLQVDIDELRRRKSDLDIETHKIKAAAVNALKSDERTFLIDANVPYEDVCLQLKRTIWGCL